MNQTQIGSFISKCRKDLNMTQSDIADQLSVTKQAVSKWETGKNLPDPSIILALCELLQISVNELLCGRKLTAVEEQRTSKQYALSMVMAKKELENLQILTEILIFAGIIIATTLTMVVAVSDIQKIITLITGCFVWGYGLWMRIKIRKAIQNT